MKTILKAIPLFALLSIALIPTSASANTTPSPNPTLTPGTQLAYYVGHPRRYYGRGYYGRGYYGHRYYRRAVYAAPIVYAGYRAGSYWTGWRYIGHGCSRSCLVNRYNGHVIRCKQRCR